MEGTALGVVGLASSLTVNLARVESEIFELLGSVAESASLECRLKLAGCCQARGRAVYPVPTHTASIQCSPAAGLWPHFRGEEGKSESQSQPVVQSGTGRPSGTLASTPPEMEQLHYCHHGAVPVPPPPSVLRLLETQVDFHPL